MPPGLQHLGSGLEAKWWAHGECSAWCPKASMRHHVCRQHCFKCSGALRPLVLHRHLQTSKCSPIPSSNHFPPSFFVLTDHRQHQIAQARQHLLALQPVCGTLEGWSSGNEWADPQWHGLSDAQAASGGVRCSKVLKGAVRDFTRHQTVVGPSSVVLHRRREALPHGIPRCTPAKQAQHAAGEEGNWQGPPVKGDVKRHAVNGGQSSGCRPDGARRQRVRLPRHDQPQGCKSCRTSKAERTLLGVAAGWARGTAGQPQRAQQATLRAQRQAQGLTSQRSMQLSQGCHLPARAQTTTNTKTLPLSGSLQPSSHAWCARLVPVHTASCAASSTASTAGRRGGCCAHQHAVAAANSTAAIRAPTPTPITSGRALGANKPPHVKASSEVTATSVGTSIARHVSSGCQTAQWEVQGWEVSITPGKCGCPGRR